MANGSKNYSGPIVQIAGRYLLPTRGTRPPRQRALIVGIKYSANKFLAQLCRPLKDVEKFRKFLKNTYNFQDNEIVVMTDEQASEYLQPTRANILREIGHLVGGAQSGDKLIFLFAGHSDQVENMTGTEEDDMDEYLAPMDYEDAPPQNNAVQGIGGKILDNELKKRLVDPLPAGAQLWASPRLHHAIFDSCHSGTLLDLPHYRCNVSGLTELDIASAPPSVPPSRYLRMGSAMPGPSVMRGKPIRRNSTYQVEIPPPSSVDESSMVISDYVPVGDALGLQMPLSTIPEDLPPMRQQSFGEVGEAITQMDDGMLGCFSDIIARSSSQKRILENKPLHKSPPTMPNRLPKECKGDCVRSPTARPLVLSISSCADSEVTMELDFEMDANEPRSLVEVLINYLEDNPTPDFQQLIITVKFVIYAAPPAYNRIGTDYSSPYQETYGRNG
ncbi:Ca(2+)-dependent cysteine protease [Steccherinum ochraceum]|uniref:Ca(2+)-dependent cysteine protease n=1 Tax=Steccherinum ochraceum TaxID=92696 RepID=A0A4R0RPA4_9APHY|nr:Ca(2+)-dependent cysteine protease [Steccherinum ochraceum]